MKLIAVDEITRAVKDLFVDANINVGEDVLAALRRAVSQEESARGKEVLQELLENARIAKETAIPLCQDTGLAIVFVELGQEVHLTGGSLTEAIDQGIRKATQEGLLRPSACHCFSRENTGTNTPAITHVEIVPGEAVRLIVFPKGGGSENTSRGTMLLPAAGLAGVKEYVIQQVLAAGANPCPPLIVGVGIGGTFDQAALIAKKALLRPIGNKHPDSEICALEEDLLIGINDLGIGPMGYGGRITALAVQAEMIPCHIASLPVAVNIQCHAHRHKERVI
jgi:fumarate hydratase subunit alpha